MVAKLNFSARNITIRREDLEIREGTYALLADIAEPVSISPGAFKVIPVPIQIQGDNESIFLATIQAGRDDSTDAITGQFNIPSSQNHEQLQVIVTNHTTASLIINPKNQIGYLEITPIGYDHDAQDQDFGDANPVVPIVYKPNHIDETVRPEYATEGSAAIDLRADIAKIYHLLPGERAIIETGVRMAIPMGYEGQVRPRSGLAAKHGITVTNSPGTIDSDYRGEIKVILQNTGEETFIINPSDRIAQILIAPVVQARLDFCDELDDTARGEGGFGSTGRN